MTLFEYISVSFSIVLPARLFQAIALGLAVVGAVSSGRRLHTWLPVLLPALMVFSAGVLFLRLRSLAP